MKNIIFAGVCALSLVANAQAFAQSGYGQVTLENQTREALDLYADGYYVCRALGGGFCTGQVRAGSHSLTVKEGNTAVASTSMTLDSGGTFTYTITY